MGMYANQAASYNATKSQVTNQLNLLDTMIANIKRSNSENDILYTKIMSEIENIKSKKESIINNMNNISASLASKAQELDEELERELKKKKLNNNQLNQLK